MKRETKISRWCALPVMVLIGAVIGCQPAKPVQHRDLRPLMGTVVQVAVEGTDEALLKRATDAAYQEMSRLSDMMNHYNPQSVVSAINNAAGRQPVPVPPELMQVLTMARAVSERSHGAFDITVGSLKGWRFNPEHPELPTPAQITRQLPLVNYRHVILDETAGTVLLKQPGMRLDLGGIAKLYILDAGLKVLQKNGVAHAMLNGGGDVVVMGTTQGHPWRVGIRDPLLHQERPALPSHPRPQNRLSDTGPARRDAGGGGNGAGERSGRGHHGARPRAGARIDRAVTRGSGPDGRSGWQALGFTRP